MKSFWKKIRARLAPNIEEQMKVWDDEECLMNFLRFIPRIGIGVEFIQNDVGFITHQLLKIHCGNHVFASHPRELDWPLEPVAFPEEHEEKLH